ncbi:MAG: choice-of-anchor tandem repeat GloVer-containing protein [Candidatus Sulfotelmatobacter sp.]
MTTAGLIVTALTLVLATRASAQDTQQQTEETERVLHAFTGGNSGQNPTGSLVFDNAGNLYGTTFYGGSTSYCPGNGCGLVYKLQRTPSGAWNSTPIHIFAGVPDGANPLAGLTYDGAGNFYGTTEAGGNSGVCQTGAYFGCGTVYQLSMQAGGWKTTVLHTFTGGSDGANPEAGLIRDAAGNLYGTASSGGSNQGGVVFQLSRQSSGSWKLTTLHSFGGAADGQTPLAGLLLDSVGNLYGTTQFGGTFGVGAVFELSPATGGKWNYQVLFSFNNTDGAQPGSSLILDGSGNLYGTTLAGGSSHPVGVVYRLSPESGGGWNQSVIYDAGASGTATPGSSLIFDAGGNLYGTVAQGGRFSDGAVFRLSPTSSGWKTTLVYSFSRSLPDGFFPEAGVIFDHAGNLYGTAFGRDGKGSVVFELSPPD